MKPNDTELKTARDLLAFIDAGPTPYHAVDEARRRLEAAGFTALDERDPWQLQPGDARYVVRGGGAILALRMGRKSPAEAGFRIIGAHTDSPSLRLKPIPARTREGFLVFDVEIYGGPILATWSDRDLGLAGRLFVEEDDGRLEARHLRIDRPLARIPNVAIHLNRQVNDEGLKLDKHQHLPPAVGLWLGGGDAAAEVLHLVAEAAGTTPERIRGHDLMLFDLQPSTMAGMQDEFLFAPRLDNLAMSHAGLAALLQARADTDATQVVVLFDHEEVGSGTTRGAAGTFLKDTLERLSGSGPEAARRAFAGSFLVSADMAHAVHPNRRDLHDALHLPRLGEGPVIKTNANQRYATDAATGAVFRQACRRADVPVQEFVMRADMPCGSTIGPLSAAGLGIPTVDVGNPMLSMHSIREMGGTRDADLMTRALTSFLQGTD